MANRVIFLTKDGKTVIIAREITRHSITITHMLSDCEYSADRAVPLDFSEAAMNRIFEYCEYHTRNPEHLAKISKLCSANPQIAQNPAYDETHTDSFSMAFAASLFENRELFDEVVDASDFLDIPPLRALLIRTIARAIAGKSSAEMRAILGLPDDLTTAEKRALENKNLRLMSRARV